MVKISIYSKIHLIVSSEIEDYSLLKENKDALYVYRGDFNRLDGLINGFYSYDNHSIILTTETINYYIWINNLTNIIYGKSSDYISKHSNLYEGKPFYEIINFNYGFLGHRCCQKLYEDFTNYNINDSIYEMFKNGLKNFSNNNLLSIMVF